ncbi:Protein of unknown function (DUF2634) [Desulfosporosinus acidiphilus SJ4]|uniref:DUF2634 domain-containing protein n=1 Tax=Desulfosporosinus acidiphilus (strain DSM 22704 / JCM 16185 / SJ4) TaxID=646529 RepID=I4D3G7_DESAJ|nr:DUF2634 domain-containing protein [Desulfosporosinus acidiphilus]AFM40341.1 Protein of unknown function (DUF2634) [Desulfosporosinus acidiphilus SJ4]
MSIFPQNFEQALITSNGLGSSELPLAKEYGWDFTNNTFLLIDGKSVLVTGRDAVKIWAWKALQTPKGVYKAYSLNFGNELESLMNQSLSNAAMSSEVERYLKEALLVNPYITGISNITLSIDGSKTSVDFTAETIYGEVTMSV